MSFRQGLRASCEKQRSHLCVGLDPDLEALPAGFNRDPEDVLRFCVGIVEATAHVAAAYKPNSAFYEALGPAGMEVLQAVIAAVPEGIPTILDVKRGDVGNTASRYAESAFRVFNAAAVTVSPYLGRDGITPFAEYRDRGVFVLCRTSNPGAPDLQDLEVEGEPLYLRVARLCNEWDEHHNLGLVTGATWPDELRAIRAVAPELPLLVPGVGVQGGDVAASTRAAAGASGDGLFLVSSSRGVAHASRGSDFQHAAAAAAEELSRQVELALAQAPA
ncbi:MAG: orotidine-5'-phosphate decarboxylase [Candidatus Dormibacteria bacterium]